MLEGIQETNVPFPSLIPVKEAGRHLSYIGEIYGGGGAQLDPHYAKFGLNSFQFGLNSIYKMYLNVKSQNIG